jgi:hypothetical protein
MGKFDTKFSKNFDNMSALHSQLFERIQNQYTVISNHLINIDKLPDQFRSKVKYSKNQVIIVTHVDRFLREQTNFIQDILKDVIIKTKNNETPLLASTNPLKKQPIMNFTNFSQPFPTT